MNTIKSFLARYWKALGALLGGVTPAAVVGILALFGVHVDIAVAAILAPVIAALGSAVSPPNDYAENHEG